MWWLLHVPSIFENGFCMVSKKKRCELLLLLLEYPKARFQKRGVGGRKRSGFPPALPITSPKEGNSLGYMVWEVSEEAGWAEHASLLWSGALVAIQTQINRGGTLELMIEEGGGGVSEGGLSAPEPRSPEKWRTGAHYAHFQTQLRTGLPRRCSLSSELLRLFPQLFTTCHISAKVRDIRVVCMAAWKVSRTWNLENF